MAMRVDVTGRPLAAGLSTMFLVAALGGCAAPGTSVEQAAPAVARLEVDVKRALVESDLVGGTAIRVLVDDAGGITLDGFVESEAERAEALRLAREVAGGVEPVDALELRE